MNIIGSPAMQSSLAHNLASRQHSFPSMPLQHLISSSPALHTLPSSVPPSRPISSHALKSTTSPSLSSDMLTSGPGALDRSKRQKSAPVRSQSGKGAIMAMPHLLAGEEVTYTPTTHRISKAKKGKKVHNCTFPGCPKIFTRAEHRRRHEANHNAHPAFQCHVDGCKKPFQRADLLTRHMERQHNMPFDTVASRNTRTRSILNEATGTPANMRMPHLTSNHTPSHLMQGNMHMGSIVDHNLHSSDYRHSMPPNMPDHVTSSARNLRPDLFYSMSPSTDSLYANSDPGYSPTSEYLSAPQPISQPYRFASELLPQRPHSALDNVYNQSLEGSPMSAGPPTPVNGPIWTAYDTTTMSYPHDAQCLPPQVQPLPQTSNSSPPWTGAQNIPFYELAMPSQTGPWSYTKVNTF